jgi:hypothetical protein
MLVSSISFSIRYIVKFVNMFVSEGFCVREMNWEVQLFSLRNVPEHELFVS